MSRTIRGRGGRAGNGGGSVVCRCGCGSITCSRTEAGPSSSTADEFDLYKERYSRHIYKVLKRVHPEMGISQMTMTVMNTFLNEMCQAIVVETLRITSEQRRKHVFVRDMRQAVHNLCQSDLATRADQRGVSALDRCPPPPSEDLCTCDS